MHNFGHFSAIQVLLFNHVFQDPSYKKKIYIQLLKKGLPSLATSTFTLIQLSDGLAIKQKSSKKLGYPPF